MNRLLRILTALVAIVAASACVTEPDVDGSLLRPGDAMPQFEVTTLDGVTVTAESLRGRESVIVFFNTTCPDCRRELPAIQRQADAEPEVYYLCISREEGEADVAAYWAEEGFTMPVSAQPDRRVYSLFATTGIPRLYRFNAELIIE